MKPLRRHDTSLRVEMTPLIDVVFLLLTFFIFTWVMMVRAQVLPVELVSLEAGGQPGEAEMQVLTIDRQGQFYLNREPIGEAELQTELEKLARDPARPPLVIAVEAVQGNAEVDRAPLLMRLIQRTQAAGVSDVRFLGPPE